MQRPDRIGVLVITFALFALYAAVANWVNLLGLVSLPLGTIDVFPIMVIGLAVVILYVIRQGKRSQTSPKSQK